ncbi:MULTISPECIES: glucose-1-phosphate adenylyltransferase subunit GlgD [unclassified Paenibacillus]|uniref:glucose-1-phosphate adenylyltransferase subunit GlgD n=1 Tax=unclassified Paenibacillus TaxID=185978 RepID=UPI0007028AFF|nr:MULTISPECIES: glucose-1-phosphate adenylyltransferase subunit GlgD [unclassified Paenibacillus]KQX68674.1 glucose-1-phosphate adenylyltransferase [Paenibacillus sp. Root444D2]KRE32338.1 glucose-1-phosphate adenylyltransferase [Paenibacillus sp. Soil724D2]KRF10747.1 glucose-1-phosphate adenylyltransferase [Paenibacillus sp. Soil787]
MKHVMGVINLVNEPDDLEELTYFRCPASVPFGGRYRLIDFTLSNMVNSDIDNVAVFTQHKYRSLMDHLGSGKEWDLDRKRGGLFVLPSVLNEPTGISRGDLYQFYSHRDYFYRGKEELVIISRSHMVCNLDLRDAVRYHEDTQADITVIYKQTDEDIQGKFRRLAVKDSGQVTLMEDHTGRLRTNNISMEMYIMSKALLLDMVESCLAQGYDHLVRDGIMKNIDKLSVYGYKFEGHVGIVNSIQGYYKHSMQLLNPAIWRELFFQKNLIYTKVKDEPPAKYLDTAAAKNALIANGCVIEGKVENSILFRGVKIRKGAYVKNSIILQNCEIEENVIIENAILDKDVFISRGRVLTGDNKAPFIAAKTKVI